MNAKQNASLNTDGLGAGQIDLGVLASAVWRGKWWVLLSVAIFGAASVYYLKSLAVPKYTAYSVIALASREEQIVDFENIMSGLGSDQTAINTELEVLRSRKLIGTVVDQLDLVTVPEFNPSLVDLSPFDPVIILRKVGLLSTPGVVTPERVFDRAIDRTLARLSVTNVRQSKVFRLSFTTEEPRLSAAMANALGEAYIQDQLDQKDVATRNAIAFLTERADELKTALERAETGLKDFAASTSLVDAETLLAKNRQIKELRERLADEQMREAQQRRIVALLDAMPNTATAAELRAILTDPAMLRVVDTAEAGTLGPSEMNRLLTGLRNTTQINLARQTSQVAALRLTVDNLGAEIEAQSTDLLKLEQLEREAEASRAIYEYFLGRLKETTVQQGVQQADARLLSLAVVPGAPSAPRKSQTIVVMVLLGALVAMIGLVLRELRQTTVRSSEDLEQITDLIVMGTIPAGDIRRRDQLVTYLIEKPNSQYAEAIRNLRSSIELSRIDNPPKVVMLTSSVPGEGKTTTAISLAQSYSGLGSKVLLIEADIRRRTFKEYFDTKTARTLVDATMDQDTDNITVSNSELGIDILFGGKAAVNAADFFSSEKFHDFMERMGKLYDRIVIDTPPVLVVPDARIIGRHADAILYVVKWDSTSRHQVAAGIESLRTINLPVSGTVLSQVDSRKLRAYGYGDRAGGYGYYGRGYYDN